MKKHLIIHGDAESGKSIFIQNLLRGRSDNFFKVDGRNPNFLHDGFLWRLGEQRPEILWLHDVNMRVHPEEFLPFTESIKVNAQAQEIFYVKPMLIVEYTEEYKELPTQSSIRNRFDMFNMNEIKYKGLINYLKGFNKRQL